LQREGGFPSSLRPVTWRGEPVSYIDTFDNEFVGYFGGIPVYHPLEVVPVSPDDPRGFACGPENLVIGGGSGEHPGLVVKDPGETVGCFVRAWLSQHERYSADEPLTLRTAIEAWPDATADRETSGYWQRVFEFAGWRVADYTAFSQRCASGALPRPFDPDEDGSLESWLAASVGEFVLLAMPELAEIAIQRLGDLRRHVRGGIYNNLLLVPPGYPVWGRKETDGRVTWGISAWRIERVWNPLTTR
jgi:hypothetical protein